MLNPGHTIYTNADPDRPEAICDDNFDVVLALCRVCGKAESELDQPCIKQNLTQPKETEK